MLVLPLVHDAAAWERAGLSPSWAALLDGWDGAAATVDCGWGGWTHRINGFQQRKGCWTKGWWLPAWPRHAYDQGTEACVFVPFAWSYAWRGSMWFVRDDTSRYPRSRNACVGASARVGAVLGCWRPCSVRPAVCSEDRCMAAFVRSLNLMDYAVMGQVQPWSNKNIVLKLV